MKARAKLIKDRSYVEGSLLLNYIHHSNGQGATIVQGGCIYYEVNPTTIEYQIGDEWLSEEEITRRCQHNR